jgi:multimeric flavodoxin WrbA
MVEGYLMKILGINGSARRDGNTAMMIERIFETLRSDGFQCEMVQLSGKQISGCRACDNCIRMKNERCVIEGDMVNEIIEKMKEADCIILGSPVYFSNITPEMKALIDRSGRVAKANGYLFKRKVGAGVVAVRRTGAMPAFNDLNYFFLVEQMIVPGSSYWNICIGRDIGDVGNDREGMKTMDDLAANISWLVKKLHN